MSAPALAENLRSMAEYLVYYMGEYHSVYDYETQTGTIAEPTTTSKGNGHVVIVYNSTEDRTFMWIRVNSDGDWMGTELL